MTHSSSVLNLRRVSERLTASIAALALTGLTLFAADARAADPGAAASGIAVQYSQEAMTSPQEAARVYRKLKLASRKVCGLDGGKLNLPERTRAQQCYQETLADVVRKIDRPLLTSLHDSSSRSVS